MLGQVYVLRRWHFTSLGYHYEKFTWSSHSLPAEKRQFVAAIKGFQPSSILVDCQAREVEAGRTAVPRMLGVERVFLIGSRAKDQQG
jgi:hypothetical protein